MSTLEVHGVSIAYEVIGDGQPWVLTPGGRFSKDAVGVRALAEGLAAGGKRVLIWDRPNTGASQVCFEGDSESQMHADVLAELLRALHMTPAVIAGGSGGSRVSLLTAARHRDTATGVALWWISGGVYGLMNLGVHYCGSSILAAWHRGMDGVVELSEWAEVLERNPANRQRFLAHDPEAFIATLERWMLAYCPRPDQLVPGLDDHELRSLDLPVLVIDNGVSDAHHTRATSERLARLLPRAQRQDPPWPDTEWNERMAAAARGEDLFARWPLLATQLLAWASGA